MGTLSREGAVLLFGAGDSVQDSERFKAFTSRLIFQPPMLKHPPWVSLMIASTSFFCFSEVFERELEGWISGD